MSFDETQHQRDEHGRFSSAGVAEFANKHATHSYSNIGKGVGEWVGKVSGRQRDVEIPLASKTAGGDYASTGNLPMNEKTMGTVDNFLRGAMKLDRRAELKAFQSAEKSFNSTRSANDKLVKEKDAAQHGGVGAKEWTPKDEKKLDASNKKLGKAKEKLDTAYAAHRNDTDRGETARDAREMLEHALSKEGVLFGDSDPVKEGAWNSRTGSKNPIKLDAWKNSGVTINVTHDRKDGTIEVHLAGISNDPKYPGDKELHLSIRPEKVEAKDSFDPKRINEPKNMEPRHYEMNAQYPTDSRGKAHPNEASIESKYVEGSMGITGQTLREHIEKFRTS